MKLEARYRDRAYAIEIRPKGRSSNPKEYELLVRDDTGNEQNVAVTLLSQCRGRWTLQVDGKIEDVVVTSGEEVIEVDWRNRTFPIEAYALRDRRRTRSSTAPEAAGTAVLRAQMPGKVITVLKHRGEPVQTGEGLVIIESMKMQNELKSPKTGVVSACNVRQGDAVGAGHILFEIKDEG